MTLKVIGAGLGRTGTLTLKTALEQLGFGPCYHMLETVKEPHRNRHWIDVAQAKRPDWDGVFAGYGATVDWPAVTWWRQIADHWPDAKVILTERDADDWFASTQATIFNPETHAGSDTERNDMVRQTVFAMFDQRLTDKDHVQAVYRAHNQAVKASLSPDRLLVFDVAQGWEPLCTFLGVTVPDVPFPALNSTADFQERLASLSRRH